MGQLIERGGSGISAEDRERQTRMSRMKRKRKASTQMEAMSEPLEPLASQEKAPPFDNLLDMQHTMAGEGMPKLMKKMPKK